jgi:hypothetical protein
MGRDKDREQNRDGVRGGERKRDAAFKLQLCDRAD